jgi:Tfp pilus assembly protein PilV
MEVIVAAAVFVVSVLVLFGIFPISARAMRQAEQRLMASHLADNRLALCRSSAFSDLQDQAPQANLVDFRHQDEVVSEEFMVEQKVTDLTPKLKNIEVIVTWDSDRRHQELRLETQIASLQP